jgi:hypothetical protein
MATEPRSSTALTEVNVLNRLANAKAVGDAVCLIFIMWILANGQI